MDQRLQEYIEEHSFCPEYLFKDWESFLDVLFAEGGRVSSILWWDRCKKSQQHRSVGSGGYSDPDDSEYMYAERRARTGEGSRGHASDRRRVAYVHVGPFSRRVASKTSA